MYTVPYILGVSPPRVPELPKLAEGGSAMAGIELFMPIMKVGSTNMQMVFDKGNGVSLGAVVEKKDEAADHVHCRLERGAQPPGASACSGTTST